MKLFKAYFEFHESVHILFHTYPVPYFPFLHPCASVTLIDLLMHTIFKLKSEYKNFIIIQTYFSGYFRSSHEIGRQQSVSSNASGVSSTTGGYPGRGLYLELERDLSPPSDNVMFDNQCYATTPSSSNGNSDQDQPQHFQGRRGHHHQVMIVYKTKSQSKNVNCCLELLRAYSVMLDL